MGDPHRLDALRSAQLQFNGEALALENYISYEEFRKDGACLVESRSCAVNVGLEESRKRCGCSERGDAQFDGWAEDLPDILFQGRLIARGLHWHLCRTQRNDRNY